MAGQFGIGAQVYVHDASPSDPSGWPGEPSGVIVRSSGSAIGGVWSVTASEQMWWVNFDEEQTDADGTGGHSGAQITERYLELAPPYEPGDASI
ncbi:MAG: hypothetical protein ABI053_02425 [Lacisediminihabitans sp.]